ncbi:MAG: CaiB/BaiF CoA transferase family protein [Ramlibacter sp.]
MRVVDVTTVMLGPYATQMLGDLGADVIKVEAPPTGDIARNLGPSRRLGMSGSFLNMNRNKRSLALDLKQEPAKEVLRRLVATADVFLHNMRPQAIARLGFGYADVVKLRTDIVYVGAYGFGHEGPYHAKPAMDDAIQAASGLASLFVRQDGRARYVPSAVADKIVGMTVSQAVLAALVHRCRTGEGQFVEVPMLETMVAFNLVDHLGAGAYANPPNAIGYPRASSPARRPFPTRDGYVCVMPYDDRQCLKFFGAVGRPELMQDPRFSSFAARAKHTEAFYGFIAEVTPLRTSAEWLAMCEAEGIPAMPIVDIEDLPNDPHLRAVGMFEPHVHPSEGDTVLVRPPVRYERSPAGIRRPAPQYAEHSAELLRELGYVDSDIAPLASTGAVIIPSHQE